MGKGMVEWLILFKTHATQNTPAIVSCPSDITLMKGYCLKATISTPCYSAVYVSVSLGYHETRCPTTDTDGSRDYDPEVVGVGMLCLGTLCSVEEGIVSSRSCRWEWRYRRACQALV